MLLTLNVMYTGGVNVNVVFADTLPNVANTFTFPGCKPVT